MNKITKVIETIYKYDVNGKLIEKKETITEYDDKEREYIPYPLPYQPSPIWDYKPITWHISQPVISCDSSKVDINSLIDQVSNSIRQRMNIGSGYNA